MEYFLNYGGLIILLAFFYFMFFWFFPACGGHKTTKGYLVNVLCLHLFTILIIWACYGLSQLENEQNQNQEERQLENDHQFDN